MGAQDEKSRSRRATDWTAVCTAEPAGYRLRVLAEESAGDSVDRVVDLHLDWEAFRPASAGHCLIERGFMIRPDARGDGKVNGWRRVPGGHGEAWSVPVMALG